MTDLKCNQLPIDLYHSLKETYVPPRDRLELQLVHLWQDFFHSSRIGVKNHLFDLGDVPLVNHFISKIQQQFAPHPPLTHLQNPTIEQLAIILRKSLESSTSESCVALQPKGSKRPFFLIPGGDGNVFNFYHLAHHLGNDRPVYGFSARGLDGRQAPHTRIEDMAAAYLPALQTIQPQGPYLLGGHCIGSFVAFEMATQLQKQGQEVALLVMLDSSEPTLFMQRVADNSSNNDERLLTFLIYGFEFWFNKNLSIRDADLQSLRLEEKLNYVMERAKRLNVFPPDAKTEQLYHILQVFKAMSQINYVPQTMYPNRMIVFRAKEFHFSDHPTKGWDKWSTSSVEAYEALGNHITMFTEPYVSCLAQQLSACFEQVQE